MSPPTPSLSPVLVHRWLAAWASAWNQRGLEDVLDLCAFDIEFESQDLAKRWGLQGRLKGKPMLREYLMDLWGKHPALPRALTHAFVGLSSVIACWSDGVAPHAESLELDTHGKARRVRVHLDVPPLH